MGVIVDVIGKFANENEVVVSAYYVAVRTIVLSSHEGGGGVAACKSSATYEYCSSLDFNAAGVGASSTSTFTVVE